MIDIQVIIYMFEYFNSSRAECLFQMESARRIAILDKYDYILHRVLDDSYDHRVQSLPEGL